MVTMSAGYTANQGLDTTLYGERTLDAYQLTDLVGVESMVFYGAKPTEAVNVPVMEADLAPNLADGSDHTTGDDSDMSGVDIGVDEPIKSRKKIPRSNVDVRPDLSFLLRFGKQHGRNVGNGKTLRVANFLAKVADAQGNEIGMDGSLTDSNLGAEFRRVLIEAGAAWSTLGIPAEGWHGLVKPGIFWSLPGVTEMYSRDFGGGANVTGWRYTQPFPFQGFALRCCGVGFGTDWTESQYDTLSLPAQQEFDMSNVLAVLWHEEAWGLRHQTSLEVSAGWVEHLQSWLTLARLQIGMKELHTGDGIYAIIDEGS